MKPMLLAPPPLLVAVAGQAATLSVHSDAGDSAAVVAICLAGSNPYGDVRGCGDASGPAPVTLPGTIIATDAHAVYAATGFDARGYASASLGTLRTFASSSIPSSDGIGHNLQSHAYAEMQDTLPASSSLGALYNSYAYTVAITGAATPSSPVYAVPSFTAFAYVQIDIRVEATGQVLASQYGETSAAALGNGVISGKVFGVPAGTVLALDLLAETSTQLGTGAAGQSAFAQADYASTVRLYLDALTPGANRRQHGLRLRVAGAGVPGMAADAGRRRRGGTARPA